MDQTYKKSINCALEICGELEDERPHTHQTRRGEDDASSALRIPSRSDPETPCWSARALEKAAPRRRRLSGGAGRMPRNFRAMLVIPPKPPPEPPPEPILDA